LINITEMGVRGPFAGEATRAAAKAAGLKPE
jgi:hypothetical protein